MPKIYAHLFEPFGNSVILDKFSNGLEVKDMTDNFKVYLGLDKSGLENQYVIIVNGEVVAKGENIEEMLDNIRQKYPHEIPFVAKVPEERMLIL